jgi:hypothetical protein
MLVFLAFKERYLLGHPYIAALPLYVTSGYVTSYCPFLRTCEDRKDRTIFFYRLSFVSAVTDSLLKRLLICSRRSILPQLLPQ